MVLYINEDMDWRNKWSRSSIEMADKTSRPVVERKREIVICAFLNFKADFFSHLFIFEWKEFGYTLAFGNRWREFLLGLKPENGWSALIQYFITVLLRDFQKPEI